VFALGCEIVRRLKRNGVLRSDWSRGLAVAAVDGIEIYSSFVRCCDACMERELQHKVNGEMQTGIQYYHRIAVVAVVSTPFPIPLGLRFQKNGEGEVACASALLRDLDHQLGRRFLDVLVDDALSSGHGIGRAHHDPISCLYAVAGLLSPSGSQPCARKMPDIARVHQENRLLVRPLYRQHKLISPLYAGRDLSCQNPRRT
jgi:hypothetical protein